IEVDLGLGDVQEAPWLAMGALARFRAREHVVGWGDNLGRAALRGAKCAKRADQRQEKTPQGCRGLGLVGGAGGFNIWACLETPATGRLPILVGGTGLYFKALTQGLSAVPPTPPEIRAAVRARCDAEGVATLHAELSRRDPPMAARLKPGDRMRIARALEVLE